MKLDLGIWYEKQPGGKSGARIKSLKDLGQKCKVFGMKTAQGAKL